MVIVVVEEEVVTLAIVAIVVVVVVEFAFLPLHLASSVDTFMISPSELCT